MLADDFWREERRATLVFGDRAESVRAQ